VVVMAMAQEDFLNGQGILVKGEEVGDQCFSASGVKKKIPPLRLQVSRKPVLSQPALSRHRVFADDGYPTLHIEKQLSAISRQLSA